MRNDDPPSMFERFVSAAPQPERTIQCTKCTATFTSQSEANAHFQRTGHTWMYK